MKILKINCGECFGECEVKFNDKDFVEPDRCPFCGVKLAEWEMEYVDL